MKTELKKEEQLIFETRPHWFTLVGAFVLTIIASAIGALVGRYGYFVPPLFIGYLVYKLIERNNNLWAVTNLRVVDEYGVFSSNSKESPLDKINNISYSQSLWGKIIGFGNVQIQTAAEIGSTTYVNVAHPKKLKDTITHMQEEYKQFQITRQATELAKAIHTQQGNKVDLAAELEMLYALKEKGILTEEEYTRRKAKMLNS
jgi:uncharacterized membrane protein YdbT with pleckstrin-like domain